MNADEDDDDDVASYDDLTDEEKAYLASQNYDDEAAVDEDVSSKSHFSVFAAFLC